MIARKEGERIGDEKGEWEVRECVEDGLRNGEEKLGGAGSISAGWSGERVDIFFKLLM